MKSKTDLQFEKVKQFKHVKNEVEKPMSLYEWRARKLREQQINELKEML